MLVGGSADQAQIAIVEDGVLVETYVTKSAKRSLAGNVYLGRVQNVLRGMEAAFVDIGQTRNAVLYIGEVGSELNDNEESDAEAAPDAQRIDEVLASGQTVLVQVTKDPMGTKGARLTTEVSIAGRYLVLVPRGSGHGISRRLDDRERQRLRDIARRIRPEGHGVIIRTAAEGVEEEELARDVARLTRLWEEIHARAEKGSAPLEIYVEPDLVIRTVRDLFSRDYERLVIEDRENYDRVVAYLGAVAPDLAERVSHHGGPESLFDALNITDQLRKALERKVWLPSGGYLVVDRAEALTVIDVNTGRYVGKTSLEDTVVKTNLEAAAEVVRQLRLRDIGGIIIIDFIDMLLARNRETVLKEFRNELLNDKTKTQVIGISPLGLVEMTRKNVSEGLVEALGMPCPTCAGRGVVIGHGLDEPHVEAVADAGGQERPARDRPPRRRGGRGRGRAPGQGSAEERGEPREQREPRERRPQGRAGDQPRRERERPAPASKPDEAPAAAETERTPERSSRPEPESAREPERTPPPTREAVAPTSEPAPPPSAPEPKPRDPEPASEPPPREPDRNPLIRPAPPTDAGAEPGRGAGETG
jgi:ribonuclease E